MEGLRERLHQGNGALNLLSIFLQALQDSDEKGRRDLISAHLSDTIEACGELRENYRELEKHVNHR